jgi:hypothetical protein
MSYTAPGSRHLLEPGQEVNDSLVVRGPSSSGYFYVRQYRARPGMHHVVVTAQSPSRNIAFTNRSIKDTPEGGVTAPENEGVGIPIGPGILMTIAPHAFNFTDQAILMEVWVSFWYRDEARVTEEAATFHSSAPIGIDPNTHAVVTGSCPVTGTGRLLTLHGLNHSHNLRFSAFRVRDGQRTQIYETYDWSDPRVLDYSSIVQNPQPQPSSKMPSGWSGILDLRAGDAVDFECEINNYTAQRFRGWTDILDDEVCVLMGETVGAVVANSCQYTTITL